MDIILSSTKAAIAKQVIKKDDKYTFRKGGEAILNLEVIYKQVVKIGPIWAW